MSTELPEDLKYTSEHEWVRVGNGRSVRVGITAYAAEQLGDIVYVTLPQSGEPISAGDACGELESTKSVSDLFAPLDGVVAKVNQRLTDTPELVNADPYGDGWLFDLDLGTGSDPDDLLDSDAYTELIGG